MPLRQRLFRNGFDVARSAARLPCAGVTFSTQLMSFALAAPACRSRPAADAASRSARRPIPRPGRRCRGGGPAPARKGWSSGMRTRRPRHRQAVEQRQRAAGMVLVLMGEDQAVEPLHARRAQVGQQDAVAAVGVRRELRPGVVEQVVAGRLHVHGQALADVEHRQPQLARCRPLPAAPAAAAASRTAPSQRAGKPRGNSSQAHPSSRQQHRPGRRRVLLPHRQRQLGQPFDEEPSARPATDAPAAATDRSGRAAASSASGVTTRLTSGMATALASGETSENCWNSASSAGIMPSVIAHCARTHSASQWPAARRPAADIEQQRRRRRRTARSRPRAPPTDRAAAPAAAPAPAPGCRQAARPSHSASATTDEHVERALRRHAEAGEQAVGEGRRPARRARPPSAPAGAA